jgi:3-oxoadipate enol-lactonase
MPFAHASDGTHINYDVFGDPRGEPLLMVQGLGADSRGWIRQRRALGSQYRCITFDNRGVGRTDAGDGAFTLDDIARDAVAVLDALSIPDVHVLGASMGGIVAQILGVRHPDRVRSLLLACTSCRHAQWRKDLLMEWADLALEKGMRALVDAAALWMIGPRSRFRFWPVVGLLGPLGLQVAPENFVAQINAILDIDDVFAQELAAIRVPTMAFVGTQDILTPFGDSEEIAERIPGAELAAVRGAAHGFMFENAGAFNRVALDFLDRTIESSNRPRLAS